MKDFPIIYLLVYTKIGRVILGILVVFVLIYIFEWWIIPIVAGLIGLVWLNIYWENRKERKEAEKRELEEKRRAYLVNAFEQERLHNMYAAKVKKEIKQKLKKRLSPEGVKKEFSKTMEKHPGAISDITMENDYPIHRVYWLDACKKTGIKHDDIFDVKFTMHRDCKGMMVSITNKSDGNIDVNWSWFMINRQRVVIDGVDYDEYCEKGIIEPGNTVTKMVQPFNYEDGQLVNMFDLEKIKRELFIYSVSFKVKYGKKERTFTYNISTKLKIIV